MHRSFVHWNKSSENKWHDYVGNILITINSPRPHTSHLAYLRSSFIAYSFRTNLYLFSAHRAHPDSWLKPGHYCIYLTCIGCATILSHTIQTVQWCHLATRLESDFSSSLSTRRSCCSRDRASFQAVWPKAMKSLSTGWEHDNSQSQTDTSQQTWHSVNKQYGQTVWTNSMNQQYEHPQFNNKLISRHNNY